jgi:4-amino-4-deoxy-L-arabinose transferase-like glycosyltransferase
MSALLSYFMAALYKLFGVSDITTRLPSLISSLAAIAALFFFVKKSSGNKTALFALLLAAVNPWQIMQARWSLDCNLFPHFVMFGILFLYFGLRKEIFLYVSMLFFALSMYCYGIAFVSVPLILAIICVYLLCKRLINFKKAATCLGVYLFFSWPIYMVMVINALKLPTIQTAFFTIPFFPESLRMNDLVFYSSEPVKQLLSNAASLFNQVFLQKTDLPWNTVSNFGPLFYFTAPLFIVGLISFIRRGGKDANEKAAGFFTLAWLFSSVFAGLIVKNVNVNRINIIFYPIIIISAYGLAYIVKSFKNLRIVTLSLALPILASCILFSSFYFNNYTRTLSFYYFGGLGSSIRYAEAGGFDTIYITQNSVYGLSPRSIEIIADYYSEAEAEYVSGKAEVYGDNGEKLLPYHERYVFVDMGNYKDFNAPNSAIIFTNSESVLFPDDLYEKTDFEFYGVAVRK